LLFLDANYKHLLQALQSNSHRLSDREVFCMIGSLL